MTFPFLRFQTRGVRFEPRAAGNSFFIAILAAGFLSGCRIDSLTPTARPSPTTTPTTELMLSSLLPTLGGAATETPAPTATLTPIVTLPDGVGERIFSDPLDENRSG